MILLASFATILLNYSRPLIQSKVMLSGELRNDLDTYRRIISKGLSCPMTLPVYPRSKCKNNTPVDVRSSNGNIIIASNGGAGSRFGKWYLRARCVGALEKLLLRRVCEVRRENDKISINRFCS